MEGSLNFYSVSDRYIEFLRADKRLSCVYDNKEIRRSHTRKYLGIVIKRNEFNYFIPLSSPKNSDFVIDSTGKSQIRKSIIPIIRIVTKDTYSEEFELKATLRISHMIPVPESELTKYDISSESDIVYKDLVEKEYDFVKSNLKMITKNAAVIYNEKTKDYGDKPRPKYLDSTIDFAYAELKCEEFQRIST